MNKQIFLLLILSNLVFAQSPLEKINLIRKNCRQDLIEKSLVNRPAIDKSIILQNDLAENLVEEPSKMIINLSEMNDKNLLAKNLSISPWSDSYWPIYSGSLGLRYNDPQMSFSSWKEHYNYILKNPVSKLIKNKKFDLMSPSEKYDFVFGIKNKNLSEANWAEGAMYNSEYGEVESWMGLCHGWAAASFMLPEPVKKVSINVADNKIVFNPSDIKAFGSLLWAKGEFSSRFIGGRCNEKQPELDNNGHPKEVDCLDNNPGSWHMAVVNQIGQFDRSFIMDASYDLQVWNQPVYGYEYSYFNVQSNNDVENLKDALVDRNDFANDPRIKVRAANAKYLVGVKMIVKYVSENSPSDEENQSINYGLANYRYDLELDGDMNIVGGEWYSKNHPDFLWVPEASAFPESINDSSNLRVNLNNLSPEIKKAAVLNASYGLPFGAFVREIFNQSSNH
jgi:hypothetical protein